MSKKYDDIQELLCMFEEWVMEQEEIAKQEQVYCKRRQEVLARMREANRKYEIRQEAEAVSAKFWRLAQVDWHCWPDDMLVARTIQRNGKSIMHWQLISKENAVKTENAYSIGAALNNEGFQCVVRPAFVFGDGVVRVFAMNPLVRGTGVWEELSKLS